jgi:sulfur-carrier protein adenylyltransferase/sulfurtransferase
MNITVEQLKAKLDNGETPFLLDVREPYEFEKANLGGHLIPMSLVPLRLKELDPAKEIIVYCHHGGRSQFIVDYLLKHGFDNVKNLVGGIDAWSTKIDPKIKRY